MRRKLNEAIIGIREGGNFKYKCMLGHGDEAREVCRSAWATAHNVSLTMLETLASDKRKGQSYLL
jgi:hypothetical protein